MYVYTHAHVYVHVCSVYNIYTHMCIYHINTVQESCGLTELIAACAFTDPVILWLPNRVQVHSRAQKFWFV